MPGLLSDPDVPNLRDPWSRYSVLSLDGSGLRVLSELLILERLMQRVVHFERNVEKPCAETSADSPLIDRHQISDEFKKLRTSQHQNARDRSGTESTESRFLPCHYFDFIVGTSTGGLVALMLGELRMSVGSALSFYLEILPQLYRLHYGSGYGSGLRKLLGMKSNDPQNKLSRTIDNQWKTPMSSDESRCKTVVCSFTESDNGQVIPFLFRSYRWSNFELADLTVSAIAKAGCCHPYSFKPVKLGTYSYYDTGFIFTNPSSIIIDELHQFRPVDRNKGNKKVEHERRGDVLSLVVGNNNQTTIDRQWNRPPQKEALENDRHNPGIDNRGGSRSGQENENPIDLLVSLGSGYDLSKQSDKGTSTRARLNRVLRATAEPVHKEVDRRSKIDTQLFSYIRLNANLELPRMVVGISSKNESRKLRREIEECTEEFLADAETEKALEKTAAKLVSLRRQRCKTRAWEAFAFGWRYKCAQCRKENAAQGVDKPIETFHSAADLIDHFLRQHSSHKVGSEFNDELQLLTKESRTNSDELRKGKHG